MCERERKRERLEGRRCWAGTVGGLGRPTGCGETGNKKRRVLMGWASLEKRERKKGFREEMLNLLNKNVEREEHRC